MKRIIYILSIASAFVTACTKNNYIDTGISKGRHEGKNMLEYMEAHAYDWDSTLVLIHHAGSEIVRLFEGKDPEHEKITFFGITNHSIRRYLLKNKISRIGDLDPEWCRTILLKHVIDNKLYRKDIPEGRPGNFGTVGEGGVHFTTLAGSEIWVYVVVEEQNGIKDNAARSIYINFKETNELVDVVSGDIEPDNCLIHALSYAFTLGDEEL